VALIHFTGVRRLDPATGLDATGDWFWDTATATFVEDVAGRPVERTIPGEGRLVLGPALTDLYARCGEPGFEERESLASLAEAARAGGYVRVGLLPDTEPPLDDPAQVDYLRKGMAESGVEPLIYGALSVGLAGEALAEVGYLAEAGVRGFTDNRPLTNWALLRRLLEYAQVIGRPVLVWPYLAALAGGTALEGPWALRFGLAGIPAAAETVALAGLLELVRVTGTPVHCMRLFTARGLALVRAAKAEGLPVTASTTVHHLVHASPDLAGYEPCLRFAPPLGNPEDREALVAALVDGTLDAVASDHTPWTYEEKTLPFSQAPPGAIGLELTLALLWSQVEVGALSALTAWRALSLGPEAVLSLTPQRRSLVLFDPCCEWPVERGALKSRSTATAWLGRTLRGRVAELFD